MKAAKKTNTEEDLTSTRKTVSIDVILRHKLSLALIELQEQKTHSFITVTT